MADWAYAPRFDAEIAFDPPPTLVTKLEDGKVVVRQKHSNADETWTEIYDFTGTEFDAARTFFATYGNLTSFTKVSYDIAGTPSQERTVRFAGPFKLTRSGQDWFTVEITFVRHY